MATRLIERECTECGYAAYAKQNSPCPSCAYKHGIMAKVIKQKPRRMVGVLCRDKDDYCRDKPITLFAGTKLDKAFTNTNWGVWFCPTDVKDEWTLEEWQNEFGKLPRKGSKQLVILETNE